MQDNYSIPKRWSSIARRSDSQSKTRSKESVRKIAFYLALALTFIRCSQIHELITYQFHINTYLLFIVGIPAILGLIISKGAAKPFRFLQAYFWLGFSLWIVAAVPFSVWKAGSLQVVEDYWRTNVMLLFLVGGLTTTWKEFERLLQVLAVSCVVNLIIIKTYGQLDLNDRMTLPFGALSNSNDYAAHLLMLLPAVLWVALAAKQRKLRLLAVAIAGYGVFAVLSSGSRGALISVSVGILYFLTSTSKRQRLWAVALIAVILFAVLSLVSQQTRERMLSFSKSSSSSSDEALESSEIRSQLLQDAVYYALRNPVFGLGPDNFRAVEGKSKPGMYAPAHNSYLSVACEGGFPAFFFFVGGVVTSLLTFLRIKRKFQSDARAKDLTQAALCMQLMMVMFCIAVGFLNFAYTFQFPLIVGISIAMAYATESWRPQADHQSQTKTPDKDAAKKKARKHRKQRQKESAGTRMDTLHKNVRT
jgi:O-antigen ligase